MKLKDLLVEAKDVPVYIRIRDEKWDEVAFYKAMGKSGDEIKSHGEFTKSMSMTVAKEAQAILKRMKVDYKIEK